MQELGLVCSSSLISIPECVKCAVASRLTVTFLQTCVDLFSPLPTPFSDPLLFRRKWLATCTQRLKGGKHAGSPRLGWANNLDTSTSMLRHFDGKCTQGAIQKPLRCIPGSAVQVYKWFANKIFCHGSKIWPWLKKEYTQAPINPFFFRHRGIFGIQPVLLMSISLSGRFGQETIRTMRRRSQKCCWQSRSISSLEPRPFSGMGKNCCFFGGRRPHGFWMKNPEDLFFFMNLTVDCFYKNTLRFSTAVWHCRMYKKKVAWC